MSSRQKSLKELILTALFLALALVLPFLTGQIPQLGSQLCPMHLPILLCGFFCGPWYALAAGLAAPYLRLAVFGMPPLMPSGIAMSLELATYGFAAGMLYRWLPERKGSLYIALLGAMLLGRGVWGASRVVLAGLSHSTFTWTAFLTGAFLQAIPGMIVQVILIPVLVRRLKKSQ